MRCPGRHRAEPTTGFGGPCARPQVPVPTLWPNLAFLPTHRPRCPTHGAYSCSLLRMHVWLRVPSRASGNGLEWYYKCGRKIEVATSQRRDRIHAERECSGRAAIPK
eukprot:scaffold36279_cov98-Isochrysis_galbana.AAC.2